VVVLFIALSVFDGWVTANCNFNVPYTICQLFHHYFLKGTFQRDGSGICKELSQDVRRADFSKNIRASLFNKYQ